MTNTRLSKLGARSDDSPGRLSASRHPAAPWPEQQARTTSLPHRQTTPLQTPPGEAPAQEAFRTPCGRGHSPASLSLSRSVVTATPMAFAVALSP